MKERILANLVHLGMNIMTRKAAKDPLACDDAEWRTVTDRMAERGYNMILIDLNEGVEYESRPEIAVKGAWSVEKLRSELSRLRKLGLEPIPKLNFSAMHDEWLGDYGRMLCTDEYYRACADRRKIGLFHKPYLPQTHFAGKRAITGHCFGVGSARHTKERVYLMIGARLYAYTG